MPRLAVIALGLAASFAGIGGGASALDITRVCFTGFCIEAREAFTTIARDPAKGNYRLRVSKTQSVVYLQVGMEPYFPHCGAVCRVEEAEGEKRAFNTWTNRLVGRLVGPFEPCKGVEKGAEAFFVHAFVFDHQINLDWFTIESRCE